MGTANLDGYAVNVEGLDDATLQALANEVIMLDLAEKKLMVMIDALPDNSAKQQAKARARECFMWISHSLDIG